MASGGDCGAGAAESTQNGHDDGYNRHDVDLRWQLLGIQGFRSSQIRRLPPVSGYDALSKPFLLSLDLPPRSGSNPISQLYLSASQDGSTLCEVNPVFIC